MTAVCFITKNIFSVSDSDSSLFHFQKHYKCHWQWVQAVSWPKPQVSLAVLAGCFRRPLLQFMDNFRESPERIGRSTYGSSPNLKMSAILCWNWMKKKRLHSKRQFKIFYNLTAMQTVSNMYAQVAGVQLCANYAQNIWALITWNLTCYVPRGTKG